MNEFVELILLNIKNSRTDFTRIPYWLGYLCGMGFDLLSFLTKKKYTISSIRVKKFYENTIFESSSIRRTSFKPPFTLKEAIKLTLRNEF